MGKKGCSSASGSSSTYTIATSPAFGPKPPGRRRAAHETRDIILIKNDVRDVVLAIRLSRATMLKIKQNLFWAFIYNSIGIPVAALGFLNPIIAAAAMALSSLSGIVNSA